MPTNKVCYWTKEIDKYIQKDKGVCVWLVANKLEGLRWF